MNRTIFIIAFSLATILGGGYLFLDLNPEMQVKPWLKPVSEAFGLITEPALPEPYNAVFCIFDASGSGKSTYSVPVITIDFIKQLIADIETKGRGEFWLTYIDRSALNNKVLHFIIREKLRAAKPPVRKVGQRKAEYDRELADFRADSAMNFTKGQAEFQTYEKNKKNFLNECNEMLLLGYAPKRPSDDYSDVIGSLNTALRSLSTIESDSVHFQSILLISDGIHQVPVGDKKQQLKKIPDTIRLVMVNHAGSLNSIVADRAIEVDNLDRGIEKAVRTNKTKVSNHVQ